ncbi:Putative galacturan 1,4-alpha-galacturonidase A [Psilocybe cubensis]|uniref:Galacturan 1,4-alpha-galacturonidase A n=2 Tax=Psilocybe cubensis TaxID=181762 RepID=A0ACB8GG40_PSICU|nr:Putative galacturan 1,4-alpha-galacturonidase A [Psilocybe cubensis]KAH9474648.1 Putative galacturan 1,4-alpha-galacturonidase A [Psilocybe cubensis]
MTALSAYWPIFFLIFSLYAYSPVFAKPQPSRNCVLRPLGHGRDDTNQVEEAIARCGQFGTTTFEEGSYNITRKMTWNLVSSKVDLKGFLSFPPDIQFWLDANNTYRVVFIQNQASWFVVTGSDFEIDAHNTGGIQGNGQPWWSFFATRTREDGDGRPISLTVFKAIRATIKNFRIESPPFWSSAIVESTDVVVDGMFINATNQDSMFFGQNIVPNTDGTDTYRSDRISLLNWDVTCGDDCLALKGNSTNIVARNITCRGGTGVAIGSLGQYIGLNDFVLNVDMEDIRMFRLDPKIQPIMVNGVYFKSWDGSVNGSPPTGGGGAGGLVNNLTVRNMYIDGVDTPVHILQNNLGMSGDAPSILKFEGLRFENWSGTANTNTIVDFECSPAVGCNDITFQNFDVKPPLGQPPRLICQNTSGIRGLFAPCNSTGLP